MNRIDKHPAYLVFRLALEAHGAGQEVKVAR
jgi:hypothetical protein